MILKLPYAVLQQNFDFAGWLLGAHARRPLVCRNNSASIVAAKKAPAALPSAGAFSFTAIWKVEVPMASAATPIGERLVPRFNERLGGYCSDRASGERGKRANALKAQTASDGKL
jgi:hypothetical protein